MILKLIYSFTLVILLSAPLYGEICKDIVDAVRTNRLSLTLKTSEERYFPNEMIFLRLRLENRTNVPLIIPADATHLFDSLEVLSKIKQRGGGLEYFASVVTTAPTAETRTVCEKTLAPRVLLPGDKFDLPLSNLEQWFDGNSDASFIGMAPTTPGEARIILHSHSLGLSADVQVDHVDSFDWRCIEYQDRGAAAKLGQTRCRDAVIFRKGNESAVLIAPWLRSTMSDKERAEYSHRMRRSAALNSPPGFGSFERLKTSASKLSFASETSVLPEKDDLMVRNEGGTSTPVAFREHKVKDSRSKEK